MKLPKKRRVLIDTSKPLPRGRGCTNLDHVYPLSSPDARVKTGTPCHCGKKTWGWDRVSRPRVLIPSVALKPETPSKKGRVLIVPKGKS
jgi:hypothetical protein